jgi:peroxiredoxin Q/BCP
MKLKAGNKAPGFELPDQKERVHKLSDYKGKYLLLYFYPRDNTPGCTKEACSFRDNFRKFKGKLEIVGVSSNSVKSHKNFAEKYSLPFPLLADTEKKVIDAYGADGIIFAKRTSFLIDPKGVIKKIYEKVNPSTHVDEILTDITSLK